MIILLYGDDSFSSRRFLKELKEKFIRDVDQTADGVSVLNGQSLSLKDLGEKINTGSLFVKKRFVDIEGLFANRSSQLFKDILPYLKNLTSDDNNVLVFYEDHDPTKGKALAASAKTLLSFLAKQPYSKEFKQLSRAKIIDFIKKEAETYKSSIDQSAAIKLAELSENDLWLISRTIKKLAFQNLGNKIGLKEVEGSITGSYDENIFALTDAISARNRSLTAHLLEEQYAAGASQEYLITMLNRQFKILLRLRSALDSGLASSEIASKLKLHPFVVKKGLAQTRNFTKEQLKRYLSFIIDLDFRNKRGQADIKTELLLMISRI